MHNVRYHTLHQVVLQEPRRRSGGSVIVHWVAVISSKSMLFYHVHRMERLPVRLYVHGGQSRSRLVLVMRDLDVGLVRSRRSR